jgi:hypothetical protein
MFFCFQGSNSHFLVSEGKSQHDFASDTQSGTQSDTPSYTKMMGDLAVMVLAANGGRIRNMGFVRVFPLQLLNS